MGWTQKSELTSKRGGCILEAAMNQLEGLRIFAADIGTEPRILERLEASIMYSLYEQPSPFCVIPDRGTMLSPRWDSEDPIMVENNCAVKLHGLPRYLEI